MYPYEALRTKDKGYARAQLNVLVQAYFVEAGEIERV
jgi:hypothetical protein